MDGPNKAPAGSVYHFRHKVALHDADASALTGRAWAILRDKLPSRPLDDRPSLSLLSDGYLISLAHNAIVKDSASPWGYIPANTIHGPLDGDNRTDRIFTRAENLTTWAASVSRPSPDLPLSS